MNYPLISEYIEAIRYAEDNFATLTNLRPELDDNGNPIMSSGNFAVVFKMKDIETGKLYAVKCFTRDEEEREERYREIIQEMGKVKSKYFASTKFFDNELFVDTSQGEETDFPVVVMDWIDGVCLEEYMRIIQHNKMSREILADNFQSFVCWLLPKHFAHGDLKPDNIIVKDDGKIMLVDYDGMFVPSLYGKPALEKGTPMYQYAGRTLDDFNEYIDDYAAIIILLILKLNVINPSSFKNNKFSNAKDFIGNLVDYVNDKTIAPLLSAYIMVSTFGKIDREQINSLLGQRAKFNDKKELDLLMSARKGDTSAMINLGALYRNGDYVPENLSRALQWDYLAHLLGNTNAACGLCKFYRCMDQYYNGYAIFFDLLEKHNVDFANCWTAECLRYRDNSKAKQLFSLEAKKGFNPSKEWLAVILQKEGKHEAAMKLYMDSANEGYLTSQKTLAKLYREGDIVEQNSMKAIEWYKKAGEQGDSESLYNIGQMYHNGDGVEINYTEAVKFYKKASTLGNKEAQYNLAWCYYNGYGVEKDKSCFIYWLKKSAENNKNESLEVLGDSYRIGYGVEKDIHQAFYYYSKATEKGNSDAENKLERYCKQWGIKDIVNVDDNELDFVGETNTGTYSKDGKRFLCYRGIYGEEYRVKEGTEVLCDESFNDLYNETDGRYLKTLYLPSSLRRIGNNVFCASITNIICDNFYFHVEDGFLLSDDNKTLYRYFGNETVVSIPQGVKYIKGGAFSEKDIEKVIIPDSVKGIGDNPLVGCSDIV